MDSAPTCPSLLDLDRTRIEPFQGRIMIDVREFSDPALPLFLRYDVRLGTWSEGFDREGRRFPLGHVEELIAAEDRALSSPGRDLDAMIIRNNRQAFGRHLALDQRLDQIVRLLAQGEANVNPAIVILSKTATR